MASIKFSGLVTGAAGKVGGQILQRGRTGYQLRNLTQPRKLPSRRLQEAQADLQSIAQQWSQLSDANRELWNALAATQTRFNRFGDAYTPTGYQLYTELNAAEQITDPGQFFSAPPTLSAVAPIASVDLTAETSPDNYQVNWDNVGSASGQDVAIFVYGTTPAGQSAVHRTPAYISVKADIATEVVDITGAIQKLWPLALIAGYRLTIGARVYNTGTGLRGPMFIASQIVT
jgi:hypothetical protein